MNRYGYDGSEQYRPITPWGYVRYSFLFAIPVVGFICLIVFSLSSANISRRCYARSFWCWLILAALTVGGIFVVSNSENLFSKVSGFIPGVGVSEEFKKVMDDYKAFFDEYFKLAEACKNNPDNKELANRLAGMLSKEAQMLRDMEALKDRNLTSAESLYYSKVSLEITSKLARLGMQ